MTPKWRTYEEKKTDGVQQGTKPNKEGLIYCIQKGVKKKKKEPKKKRTKLQNAKKRSARRQKKKKGASSEPCKKK